IGSPDGISFVFAAILSSSVGSVLRFAIVIASRLLSFLSGLVFFVYGWCAYTRRGSFDRIDSFLSVLQLRAFAAAPRYGCRRLSRQNNSRRKSAGRSGRRSDSGGTPSGAVSPMLIVSNAWPVRI